MTAMMMMSTTETGQNEYLPISDSRRHRRFPASMRVRLGDHDLNDCRGNVSAGGFCFEWFMPVREGVQVELSIRLPGLNNVLHVSGEVLGCIKRGSRIGVRGRFTNIHPQHRRLLVEWARHSDIANRAA